MPNPNLIEQTKHTRFPINRKDHTQKGPYFLPLLKKFLKKKISFEDPETKKIIQGRVKDAVVWRLILNATQGDNEAIKELLNRLDGKVAQPLEHSGTQELDINLDGELNFNGKFSSHADELLKRFNISMS